MSVKQNVNIFEKMYNVLVILADFWVNSPWFWLFFCFIFGSGWPKWNGSATLLISLAFSCLSPWSGPTGSSPSSCPLPWRRPPKGYSQYTWSKILDSPLNDHFCHVYLCFLRSSSMNHFAWCLCMFFKPFFLQLIHFTDHLWNKNIYFHACIVKHELINNGYRSSIFFFFLYFYIFIFSIPLLLAIRHCLFLFLMVNVYIQ